MGEKPFLLFGRGSQSKENDFDSRISEKQRILAELKKESANVISEAQRHAAELNREKLALRALRDEATKRIKIAEQKESQLKEKEKVFVQKERSAMNQDARVSGLKNEEAALRVSLEEMEHAHDEKKQALEERQKAIVSLTRDLSGLVQKRNEVRDFAKTLSDARDKERQMRLNVEKMEKRVAEGGRILSDQELHVQRNKSILEQLTAQVKQMDAMKKQIASDLGEHKESMLAAKREVADMETAVKDVLASKEESQKKGELLAQRERQLAEQERRIDEKKRQVEKLQLDASAVERSRQELMAFVEEKKRILADLKTTVAQNSETIKELYDHEQNARRGARDLTSAQHDAGKKLKALESKEGDLIRREAALIEHASALKDAASMLIKDKKELTDEVNARKAELLLVKQEWEKKFDELGMEKKDLQREKSDVRTLVKSDVLALKDTEDEVVTAIAMLERDRDRLQAEEKSLLRRVAELERSKAEFEREVKVLISKEKRIIDGERIMQKGMKYVEAEKRKLDQERDKVYRARELKKILPQLEHRYEALRKATGKVEAHAIDVGTRPPASRLLKERESLISEKEAGIHIEMRKLMAREREVEDLESRKERAFSEYLREEVERAKMGKPGREIMNPEIHVMIDDAREKVMQGKLDDAIRLVAEAEYLIDKVQNMNDKRMLMYDIRDLKASIKLATLT